MVTSEFILFYSKVFKELNDSSIRLQFENNDTKYA